MRQIASYRKHVIRQLRRNIPSVKVDIRSSSISRKANW